MTVKITKPELNLREKISELDKPSGVAGEAMLRAETPREQQNLIGAGRKNLIINGDFRVSQRGDYTSATSATHNQLYADRWVVRLTNVTANILHILGTNSAPGYPYKDSNSLRLTATNSATGVMRHLQRVEGFLSGRTLTVSAWVKSNSPNARVFSYQHNGGTRVSSKPHSGSGEWEYLTLTTVNDANQSNQLYFDIALATETFTNIAITSGEYVEISEVQMEVGNVATPFEYRLYGEELALCMRYFEHCNGNGLPPVNGANTTTYGAGCVGLAPVLLWHNASFQGRPKVNFIVPKRVSPTVNRIGNSSGQFGYMATGTAAPNGINTIAFSSGIGISSINTTGFHINNQLTGLPIWGVGGGWIASAEL